MKIVDLVEKCKKHFDYYSIVDEYSATIDYGSIIEFIVFETASEMLKGMDIDLNKLLKGD